MHKLDQNGVMNPLVLPVAILLVAAIGFAGFGVWSYSQYNEAKNNLDRNVEIEVQSLKTELTAEVEAELAEKEKSPLRTYESSSSLGSIKVSYPKTWSVYVEESSGKTELDVFFHPGFVREESSDTFDALRLRLVDNSYADEVDDFQKKVEKGELKANAIEVASVRGTRITGEIKKGIIGSMVLLPLRDKTIMVWTESNDFLKDFNKTILPNLSFTP